MPQPGLPALPADFAVAMAYVPMQTDTTVYDTDKALREGTLFPTLNKPFAGAGDRR
ncbi:MAG: spore coat associated protein CotJA [Clostridia bacterium]|nr:spore coat associated protein CotJA [Clostridia bacterium]